MPAKAFKEQPPLRKYEDVSATKQSEISFRFHFPSGQWRVYFLDDLMVCYSNCHDAIQYISPLKKNS